MRPVNAALEAIERLDDGTATAEDRPIADLHDLGLQAVHTRRELANQHAELVAWLAGQCPVCVPDGYGEECDRHYADWDRKIARTVDL